jgi:putative tricarboxylic transport membrane protein
MTLLAVGYLAGSFQIRSYGDAAVDSRFFPQLLGVMLLILSVAQIVLSIKKQRRGENDNASAEQDGEAPSRFNFKVLLTLLVILAYILLVEFLGFVLSSSLFLIVQTRLMASKGTWRPVLTIAVSVVFSYAVYRIFVDGFYLILPDGNIFGMLSGE